MFLAPGVKRADERGETFASATESVLDAGRDLGIDLTLNEFISLELTEGLDEHLFTHSGDEFL